LLKLNGADRVTIDGLNTGGNSLEINNISTANNTAAIWLASLGPGQGVTNITIRNSTITTGTKGSSSIATFGIIIGGSTLGTNSQGADNDNITIQGNSISKALYGIYAQGTTVAQQPVTSNGGLDGLLVSNNNVGPCCAGVSSIGAAGVYVRNAVAPNVVDNKIRYIDSPAAWTTPGFPVGAAFFNTTDGVIARNDINNIETPSTTNGMSATAISIGSDASNTQVAANTIAWIYCSTYDTGGNVVSAYGILNGGFGSRIANNRITWVRAQCSIGCGARGVWLMTAAGVTLMNNAIENIDSGSTDDPDGLFQRSPVGIYLDPGATNLKLYHNSVSITGTGARSGVPTRETAIFIGAGASGLDIRNNIFYDAFDTVNTSADKAYAIYSRSAATAFSNLNHNDYYGAGDAGVLGAIDNSGLGPVDQTSLAAWRSATGQDAQSVSASPWFWAKLHVGQSAAGIPNPIENAGEYLPEVGNDLDNDVRADPPDIGVDEVTNIWLSAPSYSVPENVLGGVATVTMYRTAGVPRTSTATYRTNSTSTARPGSACSPQTDFVTQSGTFTFAPGETSKSFDIPICNNQTWEGNKLLFIHIQGDGFTLLGAPADTPFTILEDDPTTISGNKTVCPSGCDYSSLTGGDGLFANINGRTVTGDITANIVGDLSEDGSNALKQWTESGAGNYTLTIKPLGAPRAITGTTLAQNVITLSGADRVIIDGALGGGTDRSLTITSTDTAHANSAAIFVKSLGPGAGANNNSIKNCVIRGAGLGTQSPYTWRTGISVGTGTWPSSENNNLTIQNNQIVRASYGIEVVGGANSLTENLLVQGNVFGDATDDANSLSAIGVSLVLINHSLISGNVIQNVHAADGAPFGLSLGSGVQNTLVTGNTIKGIRDTGVYGNSGCGMRVLTGMQKANVSVTNNFISEIKGSGSYVFGVGAIVGIALVNPQAGIRLYDNSVNLGSGSFAGHPSNTRSAALYVGIGPTDLDVRGNIFANNLDNTSSGLDQAFAIYANSADQFSTLDYNDYYANGPAGVLGYLGTARVSLGDWQAATGQDIHSLEADPQFASATDLHINRVSPGIPSPVEDVGVVLPALSRDFDRDFDSDLRDLATPDIGADEVTTMQFSMASYMVSETDGVATINVTRTGSLFTAASVDFTTFDGNATGGTSCRKGADYQSTSGTLDFAPGDVSKSFEITICDDTEFEADETVYVALTAATGASTVGIPEITMLTILNDDSSLPRMNSTFNFQHRPWKQNQVQALAGSTTLATTLRLRGWSKLLRPVADY